MIQQSFDEGHRMETAGQNTVTRAQGLRRNVAHLNHTRSHMLLQSVHSLSMRVIGPTESKNFSRSEQVDTRARSTQGLHISIILKTPKRSQCARFLLRTIFGKSRTFPPLPHNRFVLATHEAIHNWSLGGSSMTPTFLTQRRIQVE